MNFEDKAQYNFNLVYTSGDNVYTETIVLNVQNDTAMMETILKMLILAHKLGAQDAIDILDTALEPNHSCSSETWFNSEQTCSTTLIT